MGWVNSGRYLKNWFEGKSLHQTGIVAARLSILAIPYVDTPTGIDDKRLLRSFATMTLGWLAYGGDNRLACASVAASLSADRISHYESSESYALTYQMSESVVSVVACAAAYFATTSEEQWSNVSSRAIADIRVFSRIEPLFSKGKEKFWGGVNIDLDRFEEAFKRNHSGKQILISAVSDEQIDFSLWKALAGKLLALDPNWSVWIDWYEDRLAGSPQNPAFEKALLSLTKGDWARQPMEMNALLAERMSVGRRPAVSIFAFEQGKIVGATYEGVLAARDDTSLGLYEELKAQLAKAAVRLRNFEGDPTIDDIIDDIERTLTFLGGTIDAVRAGRLLGLLQKFAVAADRARALKTTGQVNPPDDLPIILAALNALLGQFMGLYDPDLKLIDDRAAALRVRPDQFDDNEKLLDAVVDAARQSTLVAKSAIDALRSGFEEKASLSKSINEIDDKLDEIRIKLESQRAQEQAREIRNHENFAEMAGEVVKDALKDAAKDAVKDGFKNAAKGLAKVLAPALGGFAAKYGTKVLKAVSDFFIGLVDD